jgi:hypothetical protein
MKKVRAPKIKPIVPPKKKAAKGETGEKPIRPFMAGGKKEAAL